MMGSIGTQPGPPIGVKGIPPFVAREEWADVAQVNLGRSRAAERLPGVQ